MNDVQSERGKSRLAAAKEDAVRRRQPRPSGLAAQDRQLVTQHDDLHVLELAGTKPKPDQLQYALKRDVTDRQEHDASPQDEKRRLFYRNRICAPHRHLRQAITEHIAHYHHERNHQGIENALIAGAPAANSNVGRIRRHARLGGLLSYYDRAA